MSDREIVDALKDIIKPVNRKLEDMDLKIDALRLEVKTSERGIRKDISYLNDEVDTVIAVLEANGMIPAAKQM